jgi:hypothetical protein
MQLVEGLKPTPSNDNAAPMALSATIVASAASMPTFRHWAAVDLSCLAKDLPIETDVARLPLFGLGSCDEASALARAAEYVSAFSREAAVVVSWAPSWAMSYPSAAIVAGFKHPVARSARGPRIIATRSVGFRDEGKRFPAMVDAFLIDCGLVRSDVSCWIGRNDSEPSVLVCLDHQRRHTPQPRGSFSVVAAMRAAHSAELLLLEW